MNETINQFNYLYSTKINYTDALISVGKMVSYSLLNRLDWLGDRQELVSRWRADVARNDSDLLQTAIVSILDEVRKQEERDPRQPIDLERPYTVRELKSRVLIRGESIAYVERDTTPIREVYRSCRRWIESQRQHVSVDDINATYVSDDAEGVSLERRVGRACDLTGRVVNISDAFGIGCGSVEEFRDTEELIDQLGLTPKQSQVLALLLQGYRAQAIATARGLTLRAVQDSIVLIQKKAEKAFNFQPKKVEQKRLSDADKFKIAQMLSEGKSYRDISRAVGCGSKAITAIKKKLNL